MRQPGLSGRTEPRDVLSAEFVDKDMGVRPDSDRGKYDKCARSRRSGFSAWREPSCIALIASDQ